MGCRWQPWHHLSPTQCKRVQLTLCLVVGQQGSMVMAGMMWGGMTSLGSFSTRVGAIEAGSTGMRSMGTVLVGVAPVEHISLRPNTSGEVGHCAWWD